MIPAMSGQRKRMHPHKFTLWVAMGSIIMMFAGLTSAVIVKSNQVNWQHIEFPKLFWYSTALIIISSATIQTAFRLFKERRMAQYRTWITITFLLGLAFITLQYLGFTKIWAQGYTFQSSISGSFIYIIAGLHALHVLGGVIALLVMFLRAFSSSVRSYSPLGIELASTYWHFVDLLWVYLFVFFLYII